MARPGYKHQLDALIERNLSILFGAPSALFLLCLQPPLIGYFIGLAWRNQEAGRSTYFIMAIAAVWMGCMNASGAIVRERAILSRERMFDLNLWSYIHSKLAVLSLLAALQIAALMTVQAQMMRLPGGLAVHVAEYITLCATAISATALGLAISAWSRTTYGAVVAVPIALIPQIIFSEMLLGSNIDRRAPDLIEDFTLTKWSFEGLIAVSAADADWGQWALSMAALAAGAVLLKVLAAVKLRFL